MAYPQEFEAFRLLRNGIVFAILAYPLAGISIINIFVPFQFSIFYGIIITVLGAILSILALIRMYRGFSLLQPYVNNMNLGKIGVILAVIPILNFVGTILIGVSLYLIGEKYNNGTLKIGGIMAAIPFVLIMSEGLIISSMGGPVSTLSFFGLITLSYLEIGGIMAEIAFSLTLIGLIISYLGLGSINPSLSQTPQPQNPTSKPHV
ncbi:DUF973 family protein [Metallosphaera tengchongensis]|uniref:DUF973 family protein n=1 Tax=Metallosphaera tengchongensis TaxID=1532350 RepID=A0A6N0NV99_9CREN|nr:DUF973 family protein [Metallosphaera tengchongensis]QKR00794.1 DUF973 family protein [Metallosphaera tengchongensis]